MKSAVVKIIREALSPLINIRNGINNWYRTYVYVQNAKVWGGFGKNCKIGVPFVVTRPAKVFLEDFCIINPGAVFIIHSATITIRKYSVLSFNVKIVTGNHKSTVGIDKYTLVNTHINDIERSVIINEDVWVGVGATLLSGVEIGRGAIIGADSVVNKYVPPYAVVAGVPSKIIGVKFSIEDIIVHEMALYNAEQRMTLAELEVLFETFFKKAKVYGTNDIAESDKNKLVSYRSKKGLL